MTSVKQETTVSINLSDTNCGKDDSSPDWKAVVFYSEAGALVEQLEKDEFVGRRAIDKLMAKLAARTAGDIAQQGAAPAIVIMGDVHVGGNNVICFGDCPQASKLAEAIVPPPKTPSAE